MRRIIPTVPILLSSLFLLVSCTPSDTFHGGKPVTKDELAYISAELFSSPNDPFDTVKDSPDRDPNRVYWVKGGSVYHYDPDCPHIRGEKGVIEGTFRTAEWSYGIERPCHDCGGE